MTTKILLLVTLLAYSMVVSQSFMYLISLKTVQLNLGADAYTQFRKLIDASMRANFKYVIYTALISTLLLVVLTARNPGSLLFLCAALAFVALVLDVAIMMKGNLPINDVINSWTSDNIPADWSSYRDKWLQLYGYRQMASILGFLSLLVGAVFGGR